MRREHVQALELTIARSDFRVRQPAGPGRGMPDRHAVLFQQPHRVIGVRQDHGLLLRRVGIAQEEIQVLGRIQVAEGFGEGARGQV